MLGAHKIPLGSLALLETHRCGVRARTMNTVTVGTYRKDTLYPKVVRAVATLLMDSDEIAPVSVLMQVGNLAPRDYDGWRRGTCRILNLNRESVRTNNKERS